MGNRVENPCQDPTLVELRARRPQVGKAVCFRDTRTGLGRTQGRLVWGNEPTTDNGILGILPDLGPQFEKTHVTPVAILQWPERRAATFRLSSRATQKFVTPSWHLLPDHAGVDRMAAYGFGNSSPRL